MIRWEKSAEIHVTHDPQTQETIVVESPEPFTAQEVEEMCQGETLEEMIDKDYPTGPFPNLTLDIVSRMNPHGSGWQLLMIEPFHSKQFDFTTAVTYESREGYWATYLWSPREQSWSLGAN